MKPPPFEYRRAGSVEEALEHLAEGGADAKPLAGGQSLVPAMNFRLARPAVLVDLNGVEELSHVREAEDGGVRIGAMTRQREAERSALVRGRTPLVAAALEFVGHPQIRNRGTVGGSLAHADPSAELPAVLLALDGRCRLRGPDGAARWVEAGDLYTGVFGTALEPGELLVEVELPTPEAPPGGSRGWGFREEARRHGDFALAGAAASLTLEADGRCGRVGLAFLGVGPGPARGEAAAAVLEGREPTEAALGDAAERAAAEDVDPPGDMHGSPEYRRHLVRVLARRALGDAVRRAREPGG